VSAADDAEGVGTTSAEALVHDPIGAGVPSNRRPPAADQVPIVPPSGVHDQKCLCLAAK
jgi:hypothetical protein